VPWARAANGSEPANVHKLSSRREARKGCDVGLFRFHSAGAIAVSPAQGLAGRCENLSVVERGRRLAASRPFDQDAQPGGSEAAVAVAV
jgi:hypothetical protein